MSLDAPHPIPPALERAMEERGFTTLTPVQIAVLDPALEGRDLRISSQTGSGKTVAVGLVLRDVVTGPEKAPRALVVVPTRELAKQFEEEIAWLFQRVDATAASVTGGSSYRDERRAIARGPAVIVGTPGRLLDHLDRGSIDASQLRAVVLDEADRLLDMGFREDLEKILAHAPAERRTHLVSATFPREVAALADKVQTSPVRVEGTRHGQANQDIDHVIHLVANHDRFAALVNLLIAGEGTQTLVFARTRADVGRLADELIGAGFRVSALSGEMEQRERTRALAGFKSGELDALVATDVAARGIDVQDIARVIHFEPPGDADTYTHRSGRTGRAGKKGTSATLTTPSMLVPTLRILQRARVVHRFEPVPTAESIERARDEKLERELGEDDPPGFAGYDETLWGLAKRLASAKTAPRTIARLIVRLRDTGGKKALPLRVLEPPTVERQRDPRDRRPQRREREFGRDAAPRALPPEPTRAPAYGAPRSPRERTEAAPAPSRDFGRDAPDAPWPPMAHPEPRERVPRDRAAHKDREWVTFRVTWGEAHGADKRRILPVVCRRGGIAGSDVGAIQIGKLWSSVEIAKDVADTFAQAASRPDPRDPRILIQRDGAPHAPPRRMVTREPGPRGDAPPRRKRP